MKKGFVCALAIVFMMIFAVSVSAQSSVKDDFTHYWMMKEGEIMKEKAKVMKGEGELLIDKGKLLIKEGEMYIARGREGLKLIPGADDQNHYFLIAEGERMVQKGAAQVKEGEQMILRSYMMLQEGEFMLYHGKEGTKKK